VSSYDGRYQIAASPPGTRTATHHIEEESLEIAAEEINEMLLQDSPLPRAFTPSGLPFFNHKMTFTDYCE